MAIPPAEAAFTARTAPAPAEPRRPRPIRIRVEHVTSEAGFAALAPAWNRLHARARDASVFNSWMWLYEWWRAYGAGRELRILEALDGDEPVGLLPMYLDRRRRLGVKTTVLRMLGTGGDTHPDDLGPLLAPEREAEGAEALAFAAVRLAGVDVVLATDLGPESPFPLALARASEAQHLDHRAFIGQRIRFVRLPATWAGYLAAASAHRRGKMRNWRRRLAKEFGMRFSVWESAAGLHDAVDQFGEIHRRRWAGTGEPCGFSTPQYVGFHRRVMASCLARGWLRLYCLELGGRMAAMLYCYRFRNRVFVMQAAFDPDFARWRPGATLLEHVLEHAIGEGNEVLDFLRGEHSYKAEIASATRVTLCARVARRTPGGLAWLAREEWWPAAKRRLKGTAAWRAVAATLGK